MTMSTAGYLYHQKEMLEDQVRMQSYFDSVMKNKAQFKDKVRFEVVHQFRYF